MVDNQVYEIRRCGRILNANRSYYLTRSQPPFLSSLAREVYARLPKDAAARAWLRETLSAVIQEYETVWNAPPRLAEFFLHDRAVRESGHDTTYRFDNRTADFLTVDLNSLLYKIETDVAGILEENLGDKERARPWRRRAERRKARINALLWDEERGLFFDYDMKNKRRSGYLSATTFYPLWAGLAAGAQAKAVAKNALPELERLAGLAATAEKSRGELSSSRPERQWDYPNGWAPHQILAWRGLERYGLGADAARLTYRWLWAVAKNARDYNGTVPEKLDVEKASHKVFAEYGNVGTKFSYITKEGFGWMNASFQLGLKSLPPDLSGALRDLTPPGALFPP